MRELEPTVYIMANKRNGTIYTGVTSNLIARVVATLLAMTELSLSILSAV